MLLEKEKNKQIVIIIKDNDIKDISRLLSFLDDNNIHCIWASRRSFNKQSIIDKISTASHLVNLYFNYIKEGSFEVTYSNEIIDIDERKKLGITIYCTIKDFLKEENNYMFTKKDLKDSMVVETRDGKYYLVCGDLFIRDIGFLDINTYNNDLTTKLYEKDIIAIYDKIYSLNSLNDIECLNKKLLWKREEVKKMTLAEIEKELGYPIKIVKE